MAERFKLVGGVFNLILRDGKVLMELRKNKFDAGLYSLVGGCMEDGETVKQAAVREIKEEVNLEVREDDLKIISVLHRITPAPDSWQSIEFVMATEKFSGNPALMENDVCGDCAGFLSPNCPKTFLYMQNRQLITILTMKAFPKSIFREKTYG